MSRKSPSIWIVLLHVVLTVLTSGLWFVGLLIWWLLKK